MFAILNRAIKTYLIYSINSILVKKLHQTQKYKNFCKTTHVKHRIRRNPTTIKETGTHINMFKSATKTYY